MNLNHDNFQKKKNVIRILKILWIQKKLKLFGHKRINYD